MIEIELRDVVHVYRQGQVRALDGVDLRIGAGERVALIGQNGSGKTTLVRHLNGLLRPTSGSVRIGVRDAAELTVAALARQVGLVFQDPDRQVFAPTVRAEAEFGPRNLGLRGAELREAAEAALSATGLADVRAVNPYDLGGSRRKLLALASVLAMRTPILVLDEPTTGQDLRGVALVRGVVEAAAADGRTVIAISHDMEFVAEASWKALRSTYLEPPPAAIAGARLGLGSTPTDDVLIAALGRS